MCFFQCIRLSSHVNLKITCSAIPSVMDSMMTGLTNDKGFASSLEHDLCPLWSLFPHVGKIGKFADLMNHTTFVFDSAYFTFAGDESSYHLLSDVSNRVRDLIDHNGLFVWIQMNTTIPGMCRLSVI